MKKNTKKETRKTLKKNQLRALKKSQRLFKNKKTKKIKGGSRCGTSSIIGYKFCTFYAGHYLRIDKIYELFNEDTIKSLKTLHDDKKYTDKTIPLQILIYLFLWLYAYFIHSNTKKKHSVETDQKIEHILTNILIVYIMICDILYIETLKNDKLKNDTLNIENFYKTINDNYRMNFTNLEINPLRLFKIFLQISTKIIQEYKHKKHYIRKDPYNIHNIEPISNELPLLMTEIIKTDLDNTEWLNYQEIPPEIEPSKFSNTNNTLLKNKPKQKNEENQKNEKNQIKDDTSIYKLYKFILKNQKILSKQSEDESSDSSKQSEDESSDSPLPYNVEIRKAAIINIYYTYTSSSNVEINPVFSKIVFDMLQPTNTLVDLIEVIFEFIT
jgi:hypothetical protein